jgi:hypothetical protein
MKAAQQRRRYFRTGEHGMIQCKPMKAAQQRRASPNATPLEDASTSTDQHRHSQSRHRNDFWARTFTSDFEV